MSTTKTATQIERASGTWTGDARCYRLSPPFIDGSGAEIATVIVSAAVTPDHGPETYIFAIGDPLDRGSINWTEMPGSFRGDLDHARALQGLGYSLSAGEEDDGPAEGRQERAAGGAAYRLPTRTLPTQTHVRVVCQNTFQV